VHLRTLTKRFVLGIAGRAFTRHRRARRAARDVGARNAETFANDPDDPVQGFDEAPELQVTPLEVDARSIDDAEAEQDLAALESQVDEALETSAIENGADLDRELDGIVDDEDVFRPPHASRTRDTPIADHGSGGQRGL
jgi:hypothetical protein